MRQVTYGLLQRKLVYVLSSIIKHLHLPLLFRFDIYNFIVVVSSSFQYSIAQICAIQKECSISISKMWEWWTLHIYTLLQWLVSSSLQYSIDQIYAIQKECPIWMSKIWEWWALWRIPCIFLLCHTTYANLFFFCSFSSCTFDCLVMDFLFVSLNDEHKVAC